MGSILGFISIDKEYEKTVRRYDCKDGILAIASYILIMLLYYVMGMVYAKHNLYLGYYANFFMATFCIFCVLFRKQSLRSIGFQKENSSKSLLLGLILSSVILIITLTSGIVGGYQFDTVSRLIQKLGYYFFVIALVEEIIFRGFIQTRIYGITKNSVVAIIVVGFMFMTMHIPFQMGVAKMGLLTFIVNNYVGLLFTFVWHLVFNFLYSKYNSIVAPTVFHAIMDWCNVIFIR
ncbi:MAG: hypothetical protein APF84_11415 [Gracilibacter sp. BRH_c7a]|nr:MAG: hypothetical protein APF84_11415 [Gracilibacter sp. BRH_c7a]